MLDLNPGRLFLVLGFFFLLLGVLFLISPRIPFLGKLPGDLFYQGKNFRIFFPLATCILLSLLLTLILNLLRWK